MSMLSVRVSSKVEDLRAQIKGLSQDLEVATNDNHTIVTKIAIFHNPPASDKNSQSPLLSQPHLTSFSNPLRVSFSTFW